VDAPRRTTISTASHQTSRPLRRRHKRHLGLKLRRQDIESTIWHDPKFEDLTPNAKLFFIWSITNAYCNTAGIYSVSRGNMAEIGLEKTDLDKALEELLQADLIIYDRPFIWVKNRVKHLRSHSPKLVASIQSVLKGLPKKSPILEGFLDYYKDQEWLKSLQNTNTDTLSIPYRYPIDTVPIPNGYPTDRSSGSGSGSGNSQVSNNPTELNNNKKKVTNPKILEILNHFNTQLDQQAKPTRTNQEIIEELLDHHKPQTLKDIINWAAGNEFWKNSNGLKTIAGLERNLDKILTAKLNETSFKKLNTKKIR